MERVHSRAIGMALAAVSILAVLLAGGCSSTQKQTNQNSQNGSQQAQNGGQPGGNNGIMGIITAIGNNTITVAQMPGGGQGGGPQGSGSPSGTAPQGTPPANGSGVPQGTPPAQNGSAAPQATMDTSSWEKTTWTVDSSTKITQGQGPNSSGKTLALSDLKVGDNVSITARSGKTNVADQITVMQGGMGGPGGQGGPQGSAPAATTKSN